MVKFEIATINNGMIKLLGEQTFTIPPRTDEFITIHDEQDITQTYKVVAVIHSTEQRHIAGHLIVKYMATANDFWKGGYS